MSAFNFLFFLSKMITKIGNMESDGNLRMDLKKLRQLNNITFVNHLPDFDEGIKHIVVNGVKIVVGTILKRPLDVLSIISSENYEYHYSVVLGTSTEGEEILIEMTKGGNVRLINKSKFLVDRFREEEIEIEYTPHEEIRREHIIERAKEFQYDSYDLLDLNCKIFVEYLIWDVEPPQRSIELKRVQMGFCDATISMLKMYLSEPSNAKYRNFIIEQIIEAEDDKKRLASAIERSEQRDKLISA